MWKDNLTLSERTFNSEILIYFDMWYQSGCIREVEEEIWALVQSKNNETFRNMYGAAWKQIQEPVLAPNFDSETLVLSGSTMRSVIERTAQFSINNYLALSSDCTDNWNFHNSFFFAGTVATTIGYGSITPATEEGKLFCIIFTIIGIPYFAYMIGSVADLIGRGIGLRVCSCLESKVFQKSRVVFSSRHPHGKTGTRKRNVSHQKWFPYFTLCMDRGF